MDNLEFQYKHALVVLGFVIQGLILSAVIWIYEGCPQKFSELDSIFINIQLITWGIVIFVPQLIMFLMRFKIVRRD